MEYIKTTGYPPSTRCAKRDSKKISGMFQHKRKMVSLYPNIITGSDISHETYNKNLQILLYAMKKKVA